MRRRNQQLERKHVFTANLFCMQTIHQAINLLCIISVRGVRDLRIKNAQVDGLINVGGMKLLNLMGVLRIVGHLEGEHSWSKFACRYSILLMYKPMLAYINQLV